MNKIWSSPYKRGVVIFIMIIPFLTRVNCLSVFSDLSFFSTESECRDPDNEFMCRNKECIPNTNRCDGITQCPDASDELDCDKYLCKAPNWFRCETSKMCIESRFRCDNEIDCSDRSDEKNCKNNTSSVASLNCSADHWQCNNKACIPMYQVCDSTYDCLDHSDEIDGCTISLACDGFRCKNKRCIPSEWRCNKVDDCIDNSDEENCEKLINPQDCTIENELFLCKNGLDCIPFHEMCDNITQCSDHSDESSSCTDLNMRCSAHECSHDCIQTPNGPLCLCPKGYHEVAPKLCKDINECEIYGMCDQKCRNTEGSYECYCDNKYVLQADKKTCKAHGGEGQLFMSTKHEIRGLFLNSEVYYLIANKLKHVVGVTFDGDHIYWTDVHVDNEAIVRAEPDGSNRELLITSGLSAPEDLAIDWITGNIYFTDSELQHIGVCTNDGLHCTIIANKYISKPRGIVLHIVERNMYWTDWGETPEIARASMDGENDISFVSNNILWPNGLTIDVPNNRLYWIDAKKNTIESIKLDGTDRRIILGGIVRHPYSIAVFENRIYWTDWMEHALLSCDKFTGKNRTTLVTHNLGDIYGIHIYHSALFPKVENLCAYSECSHICMLSSVSGYKCACPPNHELNNDKHTCRAISKKHVMAVGTGNLLFKIQHQALGKHNIKMITNRLVNITALAYDSISGQIIVCTQSNEKSTIYTVTEDGNKINQLIHEDIENIEGMDFDYFGNNLYWCDSGRKSVDVFSMETRKRKPLLIDLKGDTPLDVALLPDLGIMYVAFRNQENIYIDRMLMDGTGERIHVITTGLVGTKIKLLYDDHLRRIFWSCSETGNIESTSVEGDDRHGFRAFLPNPFDLVILGNDLFWSNSKSRKLFWSDKLNINHKVKKIVLDIPKDSFLHLVTLSGVKTGHYHPCTENNGNCSDICLVSQNHHSICTCPSNNILSPDNRTCIEQKQCKIGVEYECISTSICIPAKFVCNGKKDCLYGEDESNCRSEHTCFIGEKQCQNGQCIPEHQWCDSHYDCLDKTDEANCDPSQKEGCSFEQFECENKKCVPFDVTCDLTDNCGDGSDEKYCKFRGCEIREFRCTSGKCIPDSWRCDGSTDCPDLSDEENCEVHQCDINLFTCENGRCIDKNLTCNNEDDCLDNSDEMNCEVSNRETDISDIQALICNDDEFACTSNMTVCVPEDDRCNGISDCPQGEDEENCSDTDCQKDEFKCKNGKCIQESWVCDKTDDCGDKSDENYDLCNYMNRPMNKNQDGSSMKFNMTAYKKIPCTNGFRCKSGQCIEWKFVCNKENDCEDESDEGGNCENACTSHPCQQICIKTPSGSKCDCLSGFKLNGDAKTCENINECEIYPPVCAQNCEEYEDTYRCSCYSQYQLRLDGSGCKARGASMSLIFTSDAEIRKLIPHKKELHQLVYEDTPPITGLEYSLQEDALYYSIEKLDVIYKVFLTNNTRKFVRYLRKPTILALDWITNNIYFVEESITSAIKVCHLEEQKCAKLITLDTETVSALAIDAVNKYIFYATTFWWLYNTPKSVLYKVNLDGTHTQELAHKNLEFITGITYDIYKKKVYYVDQSTSKIERINYDGSARELVWSASNITHSSNLHPYGLNLFEDHLFFMTPNGILKKCKLYGNLQCEDIRLHRNTINHFVIAQDSRQFSLPNVCVGHNCSYLCIQSEVGIKCVCENGNVIQENEMCDPSTRTGSSWEVHDDHDEIIHTQISHQSSLKGHSPVVTGVIITFAILAMGVCGFYYYHKRRYAGSFSPGSFVQFQYSNPVYNLQTVAVEKECSTDLPKNINNNISTSIHQPNSNTHEFYNPMENHQQTEVTFDTKSEECIIKK
uniref:Vitellogenin receptor n=1 Tax=Chrysoperla nipponensis TaxID=413239 RepID=A0A7T6ZJY8_CHRNP|nr:vitellogenin receptor [Chrysoperla nipponensis]